MDMIMVCKTSRRLWRWWTLCADRADADGGADKVTLEVLTKHAVRGRINAITVAKWRKGNGSAIAIVEAKILSSPFAVVAWRRGRRRSQNLEFDSTQCACVILLQRTSVGTVEKRREAPSDFQKKHDDDAG
jgi:hypothetical protein